MTTALSIHLPDKLAKASQEAAQQLGVSRTEFIRQAIVHELENLEARRGLEAMAKSFSAMKKHRDYLNDASEIDNNVNDSLPAGKEQRWKKK